MLNCYAQIFTARRLFKNAKFELFGITCCQFSKVNVKINVDLYLAPCREHTSGARSQGISQFYLHTPRLSANGMNHTCLCLSSRSWYSFTDPGGMEG